MRTTMTNVGRTRLLVALAGAMAVTVAGPAVTALAADGVTSSAAADDDTTGQNDSRRAAMARDLDLEPAEVDQRLAQESAAADVQVKVQKELGVDFAGTWFDVEAGSLTVAVADRARAAEVRAAGATPKVVNHSEKELRDSQGAVDDVIAGLTGVAGTHVDVKSNSVVVTVLEGSATDVRQLVADAGVDEESVRVERTRAMPETDADTRGGEQFFTDSDKSCSMGFAVEGGFLTAGHCASAVGEGIINRDGQPSGSFSSVAYPGDYDFAVVSTNENLNPLPEVNTFGAGGLVFVKGSQVAPIGASVCRSGANTGWKCGEIDSYGYTANYGGDEVRGLTRTTVCSDSGDSGAPYMGGDTEQAQGVVSGSSGPGCEPDEFGYFQPINNALSASGSRLVTAP